MRLVFRINLEETWIESADLTHAISECDEYSIEEALRLKESHGGEVVILNIAGPGNEKSIRKGLAMGCDRAVQVLDPGGPSEISTRQCRDPRSGIAPGAVRPHSDRDSIR